MVSHNERVAYNLPPLEKQELSGIITTLESKFSRHLISPEGTRVLSLAEIENRRQQLEQQFAPLKAQLAEIEQEGLKLQFMKEALEFKERWKHYFAND